MARRLLADAIQDRLGTDLYQHLRDRRAAGQTWRAIATDLTARTGLYVSHETVRAWTADDARPRLHEICHDQAHEHQGVTDAAACFASGLRD